MHYSALSWSSPKLKFGKSRRDWNWGSRPSILVQMSSTLQSPWKLVHRVQQDLVKYSSFQFLYNVINHLSRENQKSLLTQIQFIFSEKKEKVCKRKCTSLPNHKNFVLDKAYAFLCPVINGNWELKRKV